MRHSQIFLLIALLVLVVGARALEELKEDESDDVDEVLREMKEAMRIEAEAAAAEERVVAMELLVVGQGGATQDTRVHEEPPEAQEPKPVFDGKPRSSLKMKTARSASSASVGAKTSRTRVPPSPGSGKHGDAQFGGSFKDNLTKREADLVPPKAKEKSSASQLQDARHQALAREEMRRAREARMRVRRRHAAPVEAVLRLANPGQQQQSNHYKVLGVSADASLQTVKRAFRERVLSVHPDKNPHPDAKVAFEVLHGAFEVLSSQQLRTEYDLYLWRQRLTLRWLFRRTRAGVRGAALRVIGFVSNVLDGRWHEELKLLGDRVWTRPSAAAATLHQRFALLPSLIDRIQLLNELFARSLPVIVLSSLTSSIIIA
jgi:DnaJ-domain-containing protein 1